MKEKNHTLTSSITRLNILAQHIEQNEGSLSPIELDLFMQELRNLYGIALELTVPATVAPANNVEDKPQKTEPEPATEPVLEVAKETSTDLAETAKSIAPDVIAATTEVAVETVLAIETPEKPPFAPAEAEETISEFVTTNEMENIEGAKYDELFFGGNEPETQQQELPNLTADTPAPNTPSAETIAPAEEPMPEPEPIQEQEQEPIQVPEPEPVQVPEPEPVQQPKPEPKPTQNDGQSSLLSYLKHASIDNASQNAAPRTLGESLHPYSYNIEEQLTNRANSQKVEDLRTIININDKFSFINELFHNNMKGYNDFIMHLNSLHLREEAMEYVGTISQLNHWDENSLAVKTFFSIFDRKF